MKPILMRLETGLQLKIVPDSDAHVDGHPVLTYSYSIYRQQQGSQSFDESPEELLLVPEKTRNKNYLGTLKFEQPGKLFHYVADGNDELSSREIEEVIEHLSHYRDSPQMWSIE
jgi:hypothetical protein